eukprot:CAMPEP_0203682386 /NCGR_PEP_ID=MMETSP0090-20130426/45606_1 /ASSEMBLY_ACC=CAM_ASM_001088 /TAXON_ID=426623 /ORGANISM="Chaetoceros affinis, Strain CCMP159" /LENGTH=49 /DNA_ID= /DNA_START= /DNA_END= /DNA_ORIENTATION=
MNAHDPSAKFNIMYEDPGSSLFSLFSSACVTSAEFFNDNTIDKMSDNRA